MDWRRSFVDPPFRFRATSPKVVVATRRANSLAFFVLRTDPAVRSERRSSLLAVLAWDIGQHSIRWRAKQNGFGEC